MTRLVKHVDKDKKGEQEYPELDNFDSHCHEIRDHNGKLTGGIAYSQQSYSDEDIRMMINVAEHCKRPKDMLMFLGEYFKNVIKETNEVWDRIAQIQKGVFYQEKFYITDQIMNSLGTACKMYLENLRHELRLSIALVRNPDFYDVS